MPEERRSAADNKIKIFFHSDLVFFKIKYIYILMDGAEKRKLTTAEKMKRRKDVFPSKKVSLDD